VVNFVENPWSTKLKSANYETKIDNRLLVVIFGCLIECPKDSDDRFEWPQDIFQSAFQIITGRDKRRDVKPRLRVFFHKNSKVILFEDHR